MTSEEISHDGIIKQIGERTTTVEIVSSSACSACHAAGLCTSLDAVRKSIEVPTSPLEKYSVGEKVEVYLRSELGTKAVVLAYVVPLFILVILVVSLSYTSMHELSVGAIALGGILLWYGVLYLRRDSLAREYHFHIRRK